MKVFKTNKPNFSMFSCFDEKLNDLNLYIYTNICIIYIFIHISIDR